MGTNLKIVFGGTVREIEPYWLPVIIKLRSLDTGAVHRFAVEDPVKDLTDDVRLCVAVFLITDLAVGNYELTIMDSHLGRRIAYEPQLAISAAEVVFEVLKNERGLTSAVFQPNTFAMDFVVDAPYRLQKSHSYLPVVIYLKDVDPGEIKVLSIEIATLGDAAGANYENLPGDAIFRVTDQHGEQVLQNGQPAVLRFDAGKDYETVTTDPWYRLVLFQRDRFFKLQGKHLGYDNIAYLQYRLKVRYKRFFKDSKRFVFRTIVSDSDLPRIEGWHYGDTHYHSNFTDNPYEYGGPLSVTAEMAAAIGLSWVTVTDHSYGLSRPKTPEEEAAGNRWHSRQEAIDAVNEHHDNVLLIGAEEITVKKPISGLHLLSFGNPFVADHHPIGFGTFTMKEAFDQILAKSSNKPGILYAAHPASPGYTWEESDYETARSPDYTNLFVGLQLFNEKILYEHTTRSSMDRDIVDPFELLTEENRRSNWSKELMRGIRKHWVKRFLLPALKNYRQSGILKKCFVLAGSDAHMDFNYSFRPHPAFLIHKLYDNAFGKVRTLAYLSSSDGIPLTKRNVHGALKSGKMLLTDGPLALFYLKPEGSAQTFCFGDSVRMAPGTNLAIEFEWMSTPEFGPVRKLSLFLGTAEGEDDITSQITDLDAGISSGGYRGSHQHVFSNWTTGEAYLRLEAWSAGQSSNDKALFYCVTNPIWILTV